MSKKVACPAAHRARTTWIEGRNQWMALARNPIPGLSVADCVKAARGCQHGALRYLRQDRP